MRSLDAGINRSNKNESTPTPQAYFDACLEGNMRIPQQALGITIFLAAVAVSDPAFDIQKFSKAQLDPRQFSTLKEMMNRAHAARHIPVATPEGQEKIADRIRAAHGSEISFEGYKTISEQRLRDFWDSAKQGVVFSIAVMSGITNPDELAKLEAQNDTYQKNLSLLQQRISDPQVHAGLQEMLALFRDALRDPKGLEIAVQLRNELDNKRLGLPSSQDESVRRATTALTSMQELFEHMLEQYEIRKGREIDPRIGEMLSGLFCPYDLEN